MNQFLFKKIDNTPLLVFRVFYGVLVSLECFGAIATGWVNRAFVSPKITFTFIDFEWLSVLTGPQMYGYFAIMGTLGVLIAIGFKYRYTALAFAFMWTAVYLAQKTSYNNHYYLLVILSFIMAFLPANKGLSWDAKKSPETATTSMYAYNKWIIVILLLIVFTFGAIAKLYTDWLDLSFIELLLGGKRNYPIIGSFLQHRWVFRAVSVFGIGFDLLIIPALLWKPTRKAAFYAAIFFHLFNSIVFQVGIFPYLSLAFSLFFFEPEIIRNIFAKKRVAFIPEPLVLPTYKNAILFCIILFTAVQIALPLRQHFLKDNVLWTEEGHRMSWRMMLRSKTGITQFKVFNNETKEQETFTPSKYLTPKQWRRVQTYPDFMWQFSQFIKQKFSLEGKNVSVYLDSRISINGRPFKTLY